MLRKFGDLLICGILFFEFFSFINLSNDDSVSFFGEFGLIIVFKMVLFVFWFVEESFMVKFRVWLLFLNCLMIEMCFVVLLDSFVVYIR